MMDLDTEDRVDRFKMAFRAVISLVEGQDALATIQPREHAMLLHLIYSEVERALPAGGGRPPHAVNDIDV